MIYANDNDRQTGAASLKLKQKRRLPRRGGYMYGLQIKRRLRRREAAGYTVLLVLTPRPTFDCHVKEG